MAEASQAAILEAVIQTTPAIIAVHAGPEHVYIYSNALHDRAVGNRPLLGLAMAKAIPELEGQEIFERFDRVFETGETIHTPEFRAAFDRHGDGRITDGYYKQTILPWRDDRGNIGGVATVAIDVSDEVRARIRMRAERDRLNKIADAASALIGDVDREERYRFVNARYEERWQKPRDEIVGMTVKDLLGDGYAAAKPNIDAALAGEDVHYENPFLFADGRVRRMKVSYTPTFDATGAVDGFVSAVIDVTAEREAEERMSLAIQAGNVGIYDYDPQTQVPRWDDRTYEIFGFEPGEQIKLADITARIHPDDLPAFEADLAHAFDPAGSGRHDVEYRIFHAHSGDERWVHALGDVTFADGIPVRLVGTVRDVTETKRLVAHRDFLIRELDHRVKNIFSVVAGMVSMFARRADDPRSMGAALRERINALARAHDLIRPARIVLDDGHSRTDFQELIMAVIAPYLVRPEDVTLSGAPVRIGTASATTLALILNELITNSAKYGALQCDTGSLSITWKIVDTSLSIHWHETGIEPPDRAARPGVGTTLIQLGIEQQLSGQLETTWGQSDLSITIKVPLERLGK